MAELSLDDNRTIQAIGILADVLDGLSGPGVLDTLLVSRALRQVIATRSYPAYDYASKAFSSLEAGIKERVQHDAENAARDAVELRGRVAGFLSSTPKKAAGAGAGGNQPTGFLAALNSRFRGRPRERQDGGAA